MMEDIGGYLLHLVAAAVFCGVAVRLLRSGTTAAVIVKLLCGAFIVYCVMKPLPEMRIVEWGELEAELNAQAQQAVAWGKDTLQQALSDSIKEKTQAYILEKAKQMDVDLAVQVEVSDDEIPIPVSVHITGSVSPYAKSRLTEMIVSDLGIEKEKQQWT